MKASSIGPCRPWFFSNDLPPGLLRSPGSQRPSTSWKVSGSVPETFFISADGVIQHKQTGALDAPTLRRELEKLL